MRYGLVRQIEGHAPVAMQRLRLETAGCDVLLEEGPPTRAALRAQWGLLFGLRSGDELLICSLDTLQMSTGQLVVLMRKFNQSRVSLKIVTEDGVLKPASSAQVTLLLDLLAANEAQRPDPRRAAGRHRPGGKPLSRFQVAYANDLRRNGASLRTISQLFQISPAQVQDYLDRSTKVQPTEPDVVVSLHERRTRRS